ncbi:MAG: hypothetical protein WCF84_09280 [Anaerolineae bacterium]
MKQGLMWYDDEPIPIARKVAEAAARYQVKFGIVPDKAFINVDEFARRKPEDDTLLPNVTLSASSTVLPNYVWIGIEK